MSKTGSQKLVEIAEGIYEQAARLYAITGTCAEIELLIDVSNALHKSAAEDRTGELRGKEFEVLVDLMKD